MPALDRLRPYLTAPVNLSFARMTLLCRDFEPALVEGEGVFTMQSEQSFEYRLTGAPLDPDHVMRMMSRATESRYDPMEQFRLVMWTEDGEEWAGGWTVPSVEIENGVWVFSGDCEGLTGGAPTAPAPMGNSEACFLIPRNHSASAALRRIVRTETTPGHWEPWKAIDVLGTEVTFAFATETNTLSIRAPMTPTFPAPSAENWFGEPLRIMLGQLVYPRLVERRFSEGRAMVWVRRSPRWTRDSAWLALWEAATSAPDGADFFDLYRSLLTMVAQAGDWGSHTVTSYYEEVVQAMRGSRWVWALTMASSIEGLSRILVPEQTLRADADPEGVADLLRHIDQWEGLSRLKDRAKGAVGSADKVSVERALRDLVAAGVGTGDQVASWKSVRNRVMHGELVSPYSTQEDDRILLNLSGLLRALTREAARRALAREGTAAPA